MAIDAPHAFTATTRNRFYQNRIADLVRLLFEKLGVLHIAVIARHHRDPSLFQ